MTEAASQQRISTRKNAFNKERGEEFGQRLIQIINDAGIALMASIGHRTGLFEAMSKLPPASIAQIAGAAGLNERYVKEWLGAMVTGRIVEYDSNSHEYFLPPEHAAFLTKAATPNDMAIPAQFISVIGAVESKIVECFHEGGGVQYTDYPRFHEVMAEESNQSVCASLISEILPLVPGLNEKLQQGSDVLDIGCGSGKAINLLARIFPASSFKGYDSSKEAISAAKKEAKKNQLSNIRFKVNDVAKLQETQAFDLITAFDCIHDQAKPAEVLGAIAKALRNDGVFLMQDIAASSYVENNMNVPLGPFGYTISCMHCMPVSLAQNGAGLGAMWGEERALNMLKNAGFNDVKVSSLPHDILNSYYVARK